MSCLVIARGRKPILVKPSADILDRLLFHTTAEKVLVPTPSGKPTWITVDAVRSLEDVQ